jgi:ribosome-associated protein
MEKLDFTLKEEYIHLIQLLKALSLVGTGGEAKMVVEDGLVKYNGEVDIRKRLKVRKGDIVEFEEFIITVN